jgi:thioredoxin reductase (NADPH)
VDPSNPEIIEALGRHTHPAKDHYDITVVGAGPAGLSAAVNSAAEGLHTLLLEPRAFGGQAGSTSMIRNYLGFPLGVSGQQLTLRAMDQTKLFGVERVYDHATQLDVRGEQRVISLAAGGQVSSDTVVISVGVEYRRLAVPGVDELLGAGVFYGASVSEAPGVRGQPVYVVGGGNSAGQAAVYLARYAEHVTILVRDPALSTTMSDYLIKQIDATPNITVHVNTEVTKVGGPGHVQHLTLHDTATGRTEQVVAFALFILIGGRPHTDWLADTLARDADGFLLTGPDLHPDSTLPADWPLHRPPLHMETNVPGVFAAGDVRHGSVKRVASAVGEGATATQLVLRYLSALRPRS